MLMLRRKSQPSLSLNLTLSASLRLLQHRDGNIFFNFCFIEFVDKGDVLCVPDERKILATTLGKIYRQNKRKDEQARLSTVRSRLFLICQINQCVRMCNCKFLFITLEMSDVVVECFSMFLLKHPVAFRYLYCIALCIGSGGIRCIFYQQKYVSLFILLLICVHEMFRKVFTDVLNFTHSQLKMKHVSCAKL